MGTGISKLDTVARWSMILLFSFLPIFFVPVLWITIVQAKVILIVALLLVAVIAWTSARFLEGNVRVPASPLLAVGFLIPFAYALSVSFSGIAQVSLVGGGIEQDTLAFACILYAALALSALIFSGEQRDGVKAIRGLFLGGILLLVLEVVHLAFPSFGFGGVIASQTANAFGNWHEFAIILGFFVILGLAVRTTEAAAGVWRYLIYVVCLLSLALLFIANLFDVWVALCIVAIGAFFFEIWSTRARSEGTVFSWRTRGVWVVVVAVAMFSVTFGTYINNVLPSSIKITHAEVIPSWQGTMDIGGAALTQPISLFFGSGPNTFSREWGLYKPTSVNQTIFWNTDFNAGRGSIPTSFVTTGILGILVWILFIAVLLWSAGRTLVRRGYDAPDTSYAVIFAFVSCYLVAFLVFYAPGAALSILVFLSSGMLVAFSLRARLTRSLYVSLRGGGVQSFVQSVVLAVFGLVTIVALLGVIQSLSSEILLNRAVVVFNKTKDVPTTSNLIKKALLINPSNTRAHRSAIQLGLVQLQEVILRADSNDDAVRTQLQETIRVTIQHGLDAVAINGGDYQNWLELAGLYQQLAGVKVIGAYENARSAYQRARLESPTSPLPLFHLAQLELLEEHKEEALRNLAAAVQLKPNYAAAYFLASQIYASNNDMEHALSAAALATEHAPQDPLAWYNTGVIAYTAKDYPSAITALEQSLVLQPNYSDALYILGLAYYEAGEVASSLRVFEVLRTLDPEQQAVQDAITNLKAGTSPVPVAVTSN